MTAVSSMAPIKRKPKAPAASRRRPSGNLLGNIGIAAMLVFALFPVLWFIYTSFRHESDIIARSTSFIPAGFTFDNYIATWNQTDFPKLLWNSFVTSAITVVLSLTLATLAAYSLSRAKFRGNGALQAGFLAVRIVPGVLLLIPIYMLIQQLGLLDTSIALALTYTTFTMPAALWFMKGFFDALPVDLENAARVDGCSRMGALFRIVLPCVRPGLAASAVLVAIEAWNDILFALLLTSSDDSRTWPVGLRLLIGEFQLPWGQLAAATVLSLLPVVVGFAIAGRSMVAGLTAGGLKD
ncbi:carbohydrate ABC transporter permease [Pseudarthrobacter sp. R1]|uniref:carbohydrate ABC transporter permease n=1 Tax=Pseudarthrobacter sp. R1 TaxID=2944934 RepID=UPI00210A828F|nr:carbohydrate ABC transporter permease [Pseudarthrobacter sp. R1]MCQ6273353.1 carbohydrate ABC transporter permease [Pseudarthrobacter sp. R1]